MAYRDRSASPAGRAAAAVTATASKLFTFNRSRSSSPNPASYDQDYYHAPLDYNNRSRRASEQPAQTGSSFVIRSVVKKPGGVSLPSSPDAKQPSSFPAQNRQGQESSPARRMAIEDSDSDDDDPNAPSRLTYRRSRSKPLPTVMSLGVPPGGPGGGVGYGTARSFNDGRREPFHGEPAPRPKPQQRSPSPGNITARGFQQGLQDRGRSPRTSHSPYPGPADSPSARKPVARITPGPQSQAQTQYQLPQQDANRASFSNSTRPQSMAGPRQFPGSPITTNQQAHFSSSPLSAPSAGHIPPSDVFGSQQATRPHRDSQVAPAFDAGSESPFGTVSPGGQSPGFLSNFMHTDANNDQQQTSDAGGLAGKWLKGVFGRSPNDKQSHMPDQRSDWARDPRPYVDDAEQEARAQKMESLRQAQQIVEQERIQREHERQSRPPQSSVSRQEEFERASAEHEHERRKSPPGRKPIPVLSPSELEPQDGLSQLQTRLTPAQMIIQETRSRQMAREQIQAEREAAIRAQNAASTRGPQTPSKDTGASPRQEERQRFPSGAHQIVRQAVPDPATPSRSPASAPKPAVTAKPNRNDMSPGAGPMPLDMPLPHALQEMMERFYRFERYSVPLIRCLESRISEMERNEGLSVKRSQQPEQMRLWVSQITHLMKHEIGQLRAATQELKQGRELVADIARRHPPTEATAPAPVELQQQRRMPVEPVSPTPQREAVEESTTESADAPELARREPEAEAEPVRSVSPSTARPRYTSVLGQPLSQTRLSPTPASNPSHADDGASSLSASSSEQSSFKREVSVENRLKALMEGARPTSSRSASSSVAEDEHHEELPAPRHSQRDVSEREMDFPVSSTDDYSSAHAWSSPWQSSHSDTASPSLGVRELPTAPTLDKTPSQSSHESSCLAEPLTPLTDHGPALHEESEQKDGAADDGHKESSANESFTDYASETIKLKSFQYFDTDSVATTLSSTLKTSFDSPVSASATPTATTAPTPASAGISPNKLYAKRFPAPASPMNSNPASPTKMFTAQLPPVSTTAHLGLVERKRFTMPAPASPVGSGGLVQSSSFNNNSPAASIPLGPTSAAFSTARPIGHHATLKERVAFFDPRM